MAIPTDGLVFYAPLAEDKATAETGQTMTKITGEIPYINTDGMSYGIFDDKLLLIDPVTFPSTSFTMSIWYYRFKSAKTASFFSFGLHVTEEYGAIALRDEDGYLGFDRDGGGEASEYLFSGWTHCLLTYSQNTLKIYANGNLVYEASLVLNIPSENQKLSIGGWFDFNTEYYTVNGLISSARFYNRVLSESEISALANEFNQDSGGDDSGTTGFVLNGLFLSSVKPKLGQKGLLLDNKYFLPLVEGGGGSAEYYRCASVDTSAKTWTGYRAVLNEGVYTFEDTVTTGLSYTSVTPQVGSIYSSDALASVEALWDGIPTDGLVLYAPLNMSSICTKTGQTITETDISYAWDEILKGNAAVFNGSSARINLSTENIPSSGSLRTVSFWCCPSANSGAHIFNIGGQADRFLFFMENTGIFYLKAGSNEISSGVSAEIGKWYHICIKVDDSNSSLYINSSLAGSTGKPDNSNSNFYLGCGYNQESFFSGKMASLRIYNTALDSEKVELLYREHQISET